MVQMRGRPRADAVSSHVAGESERSHQAAVMDLCPGNRQGGSNDAAQCGSSVINGLPKTMQPPMINLYYFH